MFLAIKKVYEPQKYRYSESSNVILSLMVRIIRHVKNDITVRDLL
jgi:hypothetical protein